MSSGVEPISRVAFVGLGHMGEPMAARLIRAGFDVRVFDTRAEIVERFVRTYGGVAHAGLADAARDAQVAITMLPDDVAVREVMLGEGGIIDTLPADGIAMDMGTSSPGSTRDIAAVFVRRGLGYVDAPVMGGVPFARDGTLDIMAGGVADVVERCLPLFAALGRHTYRCGPSGSGHALKAIANFVNAATFATVLEGLVTGRKFGLETNLMVEALGAMCAGRQHPLEKKIVPQVITRRYGTGMAMGLIAKDLGIAAGLAQSIGARDSIARQAYGVWREAVERYGASRDQSEVVRLWEDDSGVEL